jgi:hypothetical protein
MDAKRVKQDDNAPKKSSVKSSNMSVEEIKARIKEIEGYTKRDLSAGEAFGPDHGQDDAAYDELHDLKQLLKEKTEKTAKKSNASVKEAMAQRFPLNPEHEGRAREIVNAYIERDLKNNEHEGFRGYLPGFEYDQDFYTEADKRELENDAVHAIMDEFGVSSDTDENFDFNQLVDWVSEIVLDSPIGQNIDLTRGFNQKMKNTGLWGN